MGGAASQPKACRRITAHFCSLIRSSALVRVKVRTSVRARARARVRARVRVRVRARARVRVRVRVGGKQVGGTQVGAPCSAWRVSGCSSRMCVANASVYASIGLG